MSISKKSLNIRKAEHAANALREDQDDVQKAVEGLKPYTPNLAFKMMSSARKDLDSAIAKIDSGLAYLKNK